MKLWYLWPLTPLSSLTIEPYCTLLKTTKIHSQSQLKKAGLKKKLSVFFLTKPQNVRKMKSCLTAKNTLMFWPPSKNWLNFWGRALIQNGSRQNNWFYFEFYFVVYVYHWGSILSLDALPSMQRQIFDFWIEACKGSQRSFWNSWESTFFKASIMKNYLMCCYWANAPFYLPRCLTRTVLSGK